MLPDFIIIGAMKSATTTLHRQLSRQSGIFMCAEKEPNFFSNDEIYAKGLSWYGALFESAPPGSLKGESSTHYTKLPTYPHTVERIAQTIPNPRLIYIMRHPIGRLVSQYKHQWLEGEITCDIVSAVSRHPELVDYSRYAFQLAPFFEAFGSRAVLPVIFESLRLNPQAELERICRFIGYQGHPTWHPSLAHENDSSTRVRRFHGYELLVESRLATALRRLLVPKGVRNKIRGAFSVENDIALPQHLERQLQTLFDDDLVSLSDWVGFHFSTRSFDTLQCQR